MTVPSRAFLKRVVALAAPIVAVLLIASPVSADSDVDIAVTVSTDRTELDPGQQAKVTVKVANKGSANPEHASFVLGASPGLKIHQLPSYCDEADWFDPATDFDNGEVAAGEIEKVYECTPDDGALNAGKEIVATLSVEFLPAAVNSTNILAVLGYNWDCSGDDCESTPDGNTANDLGYINLYPTNPNDLTASATQQAVDGGTKVTMIFAQIGRGGKAYAEYYLALTNGLELGTIPEGCSDSDYNGGAPAEFSGGKAWRCTLPAVVKGQPISRAVVLNGEGKVFVHVFQSTGDGERDRTNNTALLTVKPGSGDTGGTPSPTAKPGQNKPNLPTTGANTALVAGAGVAVVVIGGALFLIGRKRRFES